jgi:hypothetical protein
MKTSPFAASSTRRERCVLASWILMVRISLPAWSGLSDFL